MKNKTSKVSTTKSAKQTTINGVQHLANGKYRVQKEINGVRYSRNFSSKKLAISYRNSITS